MADGTTNKITRAVNIYIRSHSAHAWAFERQSNVEAAELARDVNKGFGIETLLVPVCDIPLPLYLDAYQTQGDF